MPSRTSKVRFRPGNGVAVFERFDHPQRVQVVIEAVAEAAHLPVEFLFTGMRERRMADVVAERQSFRQILVQTQRGGHGARDLRDLDGVRQAIAEMIGDAGGEDLRLVFESAKGAGMHDSIAVALEFVPVGMREFRISPASGALHRKMEPPQPGHFCCCSSPRNVIAARLRFGR